MTPWCTMLRPPRHSRKRPAQVPGSFQRSLQASENSGFHCFYRCRARLEPARPSVMDTQLLESRVLGIVEAVLDGRQVEDDRVELKSKWPPAEHKTARQIAGHVNAAGGEPVLWVIGLDEKGRTFGSTSGTEPADWWSSVRRHFVEVAPDLTFLRVPVGGGADVLALQFTSDRAPYVVGVAGGGQVEREVPWREGNSTRTAQRHEMIRSVVAEASVPTLELIGGELDVLEFSDDSRLYYEDGYNDGDMKVEGVLHMFMSVRAPAYLPQHRQTLTIRSGDSKRIDLGSFRLKGSYRFDGVSQQTGLRRQVPFGNVSVLGASSVEVSGPGEIVLRVDHVIDAGDGALLRQASEVELELTLAVDRSDRSARLAFVLPVPVQEFREQDIPDRFETWHLRKRFAVGEVPHWTG